MCEFVAHRVKRRSLVSNTGAVGETAPVLVADEGQLSKHAVNFDDGDAGGIVLAPDDGGVIAIWE